MSGMREAKILATVDALPDELRGGTSRWFDRLLEAHPDVELSDEIIDTLARLVACSEFAANMLLREWQWFVANRSTMSEATNPNEIRDLVNQVRGSEGEIVPAKKQLRRVRHQSMLKILWREVAGVATLEETLSQLSDLADQILDAAAGFATRQLCQRYGAVRDEHGNPVSIVILGMGKLGGGELNFSSDIDLIFLFPAGTDSDGNKSLAAQDYFTRLSRQIVALVDEVTADGFAFRVDTRLRPFGESGPPVVSFAALESYLLQHGRGWERYAYVKAWTVGPQPPAAVADELRDSLITPFVYRRYLDFGVFESLREMQALIATEVQRRELADNIKLGPGGIREIEFIVQSLQLVRGGSQPELQDRKLLRVLPRLVGRYGLEVADARTLVDAYHFLRRLENFIQAIRDQQTHVLPTGEGDRARLCLAMRYPDWNALLADLNRHRSNVTQQFDAIAFRDRVVEEGNRLQRRLAEAWESSADAEAWTALLSDEGFRMAGGVAERLVAFSNAPGTQQIDSDARRRLQRFMPDLLLLIRESEQPVTALIRILAVVEKVLRRSAYLALLNENSRVMARLVSLCERSTYIAEQISRYPILLDELLDPGAESAYVPKDELNSELYHRLEYCAAEDMEEQVSVLGQFQRANLFRVAVADFTGNLPIMKVSDSLTELAETVLSHTLRIAWQEITAKHGAPEYLVDGQRHQAGFGIIGYGKLGGLEMSYGSDLDIVFLHDSQGSEQTTSGSRSIDNTMFFTRLVRRLAHFLTTQTGSGLLYEVDMRLRPDGHSGLLVSSVDAFERYQEENAWTWEHQALLRARPVAGSDKIAQEFVRIRADTLSRRVRRDKLRDDVVSMRQRMRAKLDKSDADQFDLKQGVGGIGDIEFIVQYLVLANADEHPQVYYYSDNIRQLEALAAVGSIDEKTSSRLQEVYRLFRLRLHHLILDEQKPLLAAHDLANERSFVIEIWEQVLGADVS